MLRHCPSFAFGLALALSASSLACATPPSDDGATIESEINRDFVDLSRAAVIEEFVVDARNVYFITFEGEDQYTISARPLDASGPARTLWEGKWLTRGNAEPVGLLTQDDQNLYFPTSERVNGGPLSEVKLWSLPKSGGAATLLHDLDNRAIRRITTSNQSDRIFLWMINQAEISTASKTGSSPGQLASTGVQFLGNDWKIEGEFAYFLRSGSLITAPVDNLKAERVLHEPLPRFNDLGGVLVTRPGQDFFAVMTKENGTDYLIHKTGAETTTLPITGTSETLGPVTATNTICRTHFHSVGRLSCFQQGRDTEVVIRENGVTAVERVGDRIVWTEKAGSSLSKLRTLRLAN
jgi:hypothetical protein